MLLFIQVEEYERVHAQCLGVSLAGSGQASHYIFLQLFFLKSNFFSRPSPSLPLHVLTHEIPGRDMLLDILSDSPNHTVLKCVEMTK